MVFCSSNSPHEEEMEQSHGARDHYLRGFLLDGVSVVSQ
jgi:hypothetical protein